MRAFKRLNDNYRLAKTNMPATERRSDGGYNYMGIYTPKISPTKLLWGKNDVRTAIQLFYTPAKKISGYAPAAITKKYSVSVS